MHIEIVYFDYIAEFVFTGTRSWIALLQILNSMLDFVFFFFLDDQDTMGTVASPTFSIGRI